MRFNRFFTLLLAVFLSLPVFAGEGMWLPLLLKSNEAEMQAMGMKITAEDIYSINQSSLKDAIVRFGGGCTGELISAEGLLLTNHHCGFGQIQKHSTLEKDYLKNGFWAMSREEELTNPGLTVTFIVRMEDVTEKVLKDADLAADENSRKALITERISAISAEAIKNTHYKAEIKPFYYGNEYYLFVMEEFRDVRLVGAPPSSIGKFGGETDNLVWPRHNGDFSVFRVYSGPDGKPADYSPQNIPLKPRHFLPISLEGVEEGDFTMVYGFPGSTQQYLPSFAVDMIIKVQDPIRIELREKRLSVMNREMKKSEAVRLLYANKEKNISNGYKMWKGEIRGLNRNETVRNKKLFEQEFLQRIATNPEWQKNYGDLLSQYESYYREITPAIAQISFFQEGGDQIELMKVAWKMAEALGEIQETRNEERKEEEIEKLRRFGRKFYREYNETIDRETMGLILEAYYKYFKEEDLPTLIPVINERFSGDFHAYANYVFENSNFVSERNFNELLNNFDAAKIQDDPAFGLMSSLYQSYFRYSPQYTALNQKIEQLNRTYMKALREVFPERTFYPDANLTLRVTYGKVQGMKPNDAVNYNYYTTLGGIVEKGIPGDYDFDIPPKLVDLYQTRDFGPYAHKDGELRVCFIASNHTSGGNSGSPVINGEGHLVGLNFDRNWEGTMSNINYDINQCRNISVDIRYVLFVIDKFAGAGYLLKEMKLVTAEN
ncbi:MAG: S46 family peptidase [Bacteroidia bacterium]|nr:S46 family peptidase [Bacteroidia bacterium]